MARIHRRVKTGRLVVRASDGTFTGTAHIIILIGYGFTFPSPREQRLGGAYGYEFASLHGPNGFPGDTGAVIR